jgi:DNA-damage-inducible protein J
MRYNVAQEEIDAMPDNSVVRARIDDRTKREAAAALKKIGLTVSDAFRLLLVRVAAEKALPFEPLNPNAETVGAVKTARRGELIKAGKPDKLLRSLNARGYTLDELLAQCNPKARRAKEEQEWLESKPVGGELI